MSYYEYPYFDRPLDFEGGRLYYPYGGDVFSLTPYRFSVMNADDGRVNFRLDLVRGATPGDPDYAYLELRLTADYAADRALKYLRKDHPNAVLTRCVLTDWTFQLAPGPATVELPQELRDGVQLASNGLGSARLIMPLSIESGLLIESIVRDGRTPFPVIAAARMAGVSPRVPAVVRFRASELLTELEELLTADRTMARGPLVDFFNRDMTALPLQVSGLVGPDQGNAFAETMADRVIDRFGSNPSFGGDGVEPFFELPTSSDPGETDFFWSLMEPYLTSRYVVLSFDLLSDVRHVIQSDTDGAFVIFHTSASLPSLGHSVVKVFCNLPTERVGIAALGATLTFPSNPPDRPQEKIVTVEFNPPDDVAQAEVRLAPGEPLNYTYSTFAVVADEQGVRQIDGPERSGTGSTLRLSPDDFPLAFALVEMGPDLAHQASVSGTCLYDRDGKEYLIPFALDSGRLAASIALPKDRTSQTIHCSAVARQGNGVLHLGPFDASQVRLNLASFPEYGTHEVEIECLFDGRTSLYASDFLAEGDPDIFGNITVLVFTPDQPRRRFMWFARSPFSPGFLYRPHQDDGVPAAWHRVASVLPIMVIRPEEARPREAIEVGEVSERAMRRLGSNGNGHRSESIRQARRESAEASTTGSLPLSPEPEPTDVLLYSDSSNLARKFYIPRYVLSVQTVSGRQEYRIAMGQDASGSTLTVHLQSVPAEPISDVARDAEVFPHDIAVRFEFLSSPPYTARKTLEFEEVTRNGAEVRASVHFASLEERDEVYRALTDANRDARLIVQRRFDVALPQVTAPLLPLDDAGNPILVNVLPLRPKLGWNPRVPIEPDPVPDWTGINVLVNPINTGLTATFATDPPDRLLKPGLAATNLMNTAVLATRFEASPVMMRARAVDAVFLKNPGVFVIDDWVSPVNVMSLPTPVLAFTGREGGDGLVTCKLSITNWNEFSADFFQASPDLPPCGMNPEASRTWIDIFDAATDARLYGFCALSDPSNLADLWFAAQSDQMPASVYVQMEDRRAAVVRKSNVVETASPQPVEPTYVAAHRDLDVAVEPAPFTFLPDLHGYIFRGIQPGSGDSRLVRFRVSWLGTFHTYLQDASRPEVVYFFPDSFRVARRTDPPFTPYITVRVSGQGGGADADVVFDYIVAPHTNAERLTGARAALLADPQFGASNVQFQPFVTDDVRFFIDRPTQQGTKLEERTGVSLVLQGALKDTLVMKLPDFQLLFDAMHRDTASLFLGRVEIDVPGETTEVIPFSARMTELEGGIFVFTAAANASGGADVLLTNAIESPVRIEALPTTISRNGETATATVEGLSLPVASLAPASSLQLSVSPSRPLNGSGEPEVAFNLSAVTVLPDPALILESILDRTTLQYFDTITVKAIANLFEPVADRPGDQVIVILVEFEGGGTAELNGSTLESKVRIDYPIDDVILRRAVDTSYRYTVTVVRADGRQERDAEPRQGTARTFFVSISK
jgi:hypothetical protein